MLPTSSCTRCSINLLRTAHAIKRRVQLRHQSTSEKIDIKELLSKPSWSVTESLLPSADDLSAMNEVTPAQLHHLLRLSALPQPRNDAEEREMLRTLHMQLHFVKQIRSVETAGLEPMVAIRDETDAAKQETTIGLRDAAIAEALRTEEFLGRNRRPRRTRDAEVDTRGAEDWNCGGTAKKTVNGYFVVDSGRASKLSSDGTTPKKAPKKLEYETIVDLVRVQKGALPKSRAVSD